MMSWFNNEFKKYLSNKKTYSADEIKEKLKIEIIWNQLIYELYNRQVNIDENELLKRIADEKNFINEYLLYEIFFKIESSENLNKKKEKKVSTEKNGHIVCYNCNFANPITVSYTHLTLPTNREV